MPGIVDQSDSANDSILFVDHCVKTKWLGSSVGRVPARQVRGPGFKSRSGKDFFLPCDIWWFSVGPRLGPRASKSACLVCSTVVPGRFGDESN